MIGAIAGDIVGSVYEGDPIKTTDFPLFAPECRFTDDSVLSVALANAILEYQPYCDSLQTFGRRYPHAGYGAGFHGWLMRPDSQPYNSWGNGSAMRVSPIGFAFETEERVIAEAKRSAECTHNHPEGIKGAQAVALAILLARKGLSKARIRRELEQRFGYDLGRTPDDIRPGYGFDVSCQGSVPESIICFLYAQDWESTVRNAVSLGGDSDTMACIAGGIAEAFHGPVNPGVREQVRNILAPELWQVTARFHARYVERRNS
ncbi:MAG: ADP-ribosylglycohydrolase family protein [Gammaproteobacteria bacterium]|jgi:ADP-ribosylglycohydrolase